MPPPLRQEEEDFTVWVVNNAEDPWMEDQVWGQDQDAYNNYLDVMEKPSQNGTVQNARFSAVSEMQSRNLLHYDLPQSAISTNSLETVTLLQPKTIALPYDDSAEFFSKN
jgi:hypothetical protein